MRASAATSTRLSSRPSSLPACQPAKGLSEERLVGPDGSGFCIAEKVLSAELFVI
jgi:hypothetical protein